MMDSEHPLFYTQWGVVQKIGGIDPQLMPQLSFDRDAAEGYKDFLERRDREVQRKAEEEEANDFPDGNESWQRWHTGITFGRRPLKEASYCLVTRRVSDWQETE